MFFVGVCVAGETNQTIRINHAASLQQQVLVVLTTHAALDHPVGINETVIVDQKSHKPNVPWSFKQRYQKRQKFPKQNNSNIKQPR
jgi:hypothetical protein